MNFKVEELNVFVAENRSELGQISARNVSLKIKELLEKKDEIRMIFAAAPSQDEFLNELVSDKTIDWSRIVAFHMDEYIGLDENAEQLFSRYLNNHIFNKVNFKKVHLIDSQAKDNIRECLRYESLLKEKPIDIVCMGIGENGHIAFNDPPVADFCDAMYVKVVELEEKCKHQQVNDGAFSSVENVPPSAFTLTVPALLDADYLNVVVPGLRKAQAVCDTLAGPVSTRCPASVIRTHPDASLYLDGDSASLFNEITK
ncbi:MAG: glucosamine-6-phosphate deaminase [Acidobacteriota bacterium]